MAARCCWVKDWPNTTSSDICSRIRSKSAFLWKTKRKHKWACNIKHLSEWRSFSSCTVRSYGSEPGQATTFFLLSDDTIEQRDVPRKNTKMLRLSEETEHRPIRSNLEYVLWHWQRLDRSKKEEEDLRERKPKSHCRPNDCHDLCPSFSRWSQPILWCSHPDLHHQLAIHEKCISHPFQIIPCTHFQHAALQQLEDLFTRDVLFTFQRIAIESD